MTTLIDILQNEEQLAVIFAHIHRRRVEISLALRPAGIVGVEDYYLASATDLVDLLVIRSFHAALADTRSWEDYLAWERRYDEEKVIAAQLSLRPEYDRDDTDAEGLAIGVGYYLAQIVMFGLDGRFDAKQAYAAINPSVDVKVAA